VTASASREQMGYTYDALKTYMPEMVEVLIDSVRNPVFLDWEVNEQVSYFVRSLPFSSVAREWNLDWMC